MKYLILGAGALGTIISAYLARAGRNVSLIARGERSRWIRENGAKITGLETFSVAVPIIENPKTIDRADVVILATKTYDNIEAIESIRHIRAESIFSIQNGVLKNEQLVQVFGEACVIGSVGMIGGSIENDGSANYMLSNPIILGEIKGGTSHRVQQIVTELKGSNLLSEESSNIKSEEWSKFVGWLGISAVAVLTRIETWKFLVDPDAARIVARIVKEMACLQQKLGIELKPGPPFELDLIVSATEDQAVDLLRRRGFLQKETAPEFRQSMLQDMDKRKRIEVEETFGYAIQKSQELNIEMPTVEICYRILSSVNRLGR